MVCIECIKRGTKNILYYSTLPDLEGVSSGLQLFTIFKKQTRITPKDVSFLVELLETINRKDLVKIAITWPITTTSREQRQPMISRYRQVYY